MKEIEIAIKLLQDKEDILLKLQNYINVGMKHTLDIYFYDEIRKNLSPNEDNKLFECFRIRNRDDKSYMTYKVDNFEGETWIYSDEDEIEISDFKVAYNIVKKLGLKELVRIDLNTYIYLFEQYEIVLEDVKDLGLFLEVEKLNVPDETSYEEVKKIKSQIREFIDSFGIEYVELNDGKPELMLKRNKSENPK